MKYRQHDKAYHCGKRSPSMRREWIEISVRTPEYHTAFRSPSMRREWIEMLSLSRYVRIPARSPSMRREWIEMTVFFKKIVVRHMVSLHAEGVD